MINYNIIATITAASAMITMIIIIIITTTIIAITIITITIITANIITSINCPCNFYMLSIYFNRINGKEWEMSHNKCNIIALLDLRRAQTMLTEL